MENAPTWSTQQAHLKILIFSPFRPSPLKKKNVNEKNFLCTFERTHHLAHSIKKHFLRSPEHRNFQKHTDLCAVVMPSEDTNLLEFN